MGLIQDENGRYLPEGGPTDPKTITRAPPGMLRIVQVDPRDNWPTLVEDCPNLEAVAAVFSQTWRPKSDTYVVRDHDNVIVPFPPHN